ncbi:MAG TPA: hypothetical protein VHJ82_09150 [Actinomycetota bacterium]|nr:hypothetical protein [Actinomycetota bacterium]
MDAETFVCDRCGREWPRNQMKEVFKEEGGERVKLTVDPECLDEIMAETGKVTGTPGDEKQMAAEVVEEGPGPAERESMKE